MHVAPSADDEAQGREVSTVKVAAPLSVFVVKSLRALMLGLLLAVVSGAIFFPCIAAMLK
jgi:hypothetical protein